MDKKTIFAFILITVVLVLTPWYINLVAPKTAAEPDSLILTPDKLTNNEIVPFVRPPVEKLIKPKINNTSDEIILIVSNNLFTANISNLNGGSFKNFTLNNYAKFDSSNVDLINKDSWGNLLIEFISIDGELIRLNGPWQINSPKNNITILDKPQTITFSTSYNNKKITKSFTFYPDLYQIDVNINMSELDPLISQGKYSLLWIGGLPPTEKNTKDDFNYFKSSASLGGELVTVKVKNGGPVVEEQAGKTDWVATQTKYFIAALLPKDPGVGVKIKGIKNGDNPIYDFTLYNKVQGNGQIKLFLGPLEYKRIQQLGVGLENTMNLGWTLIRPIGRFITWSLTAMHKVIPNYGIVLILFSVLVKIVLNPLTKKSYQSTKKMQALQPRIAQLKEKYKHDSQKLNKAQMELFKKEGVNPLGGCLPVVLQMPLLFALFTVFRTTIEFRGAPFIFWIKDLSVPDTLTYIGTFPINILPLLMGITMFFQQKMTQAPTVGQNKYSMYFMNVFFLFIFYRFPSGLNLYYTVFNALTIVQQKYFTPVPPLSPEKAVSIKGKTKKKK
ncbi:MAG: membrane protein insertase YidC [Fidelibacterota bacterium]